MNKDICECGHPKHNHVGMMYMNEGKLIEENNDCAKHGCKCRKYKPISD